MSLDTSTLMKFFSPRVVAKVLASLDKSMALVVGACWAAASVMLILAVLAVHGAVSSKREAGAAIVAEPVLPKISSTPMNPREIQVLLDRLQRQFPDVKITVQQNQQVSISCSEGNKFHQWVSALSYIDTMASQYKWEIKEFCVGACGTNNLMKAVVAGQKTVFSLPQK